MATEITEIGEGFVLQGDAELSDDEPETEEEILARTIIARLRQRKPKAALDACAQLMQNIKVNNGL